MRARLLIVTFALPCAWQYVVLSRARTKVGLHLMRPLPDDALYSPRLDALLEQARRRLDVNFLLITAHGASSPLEPTTVDELVQQQALLLRTWFDARAAFNVPIGAKPHQDYQHVRPRSGTTA